MTDQPKWLLASKTVLGIVVAALPTVLPLFGVAFTADDTAMVSQGVDATITLAGTILAIYGRVTASQSVTLTPTTTTDT